MTECPPGTVADTADNDFKCINCSDNCSVCAGSPDVCSTCPAGYKLNMLDYTCVQECTADITVEGELITNDGGIETRIPTCELCDSNCLTCSEFTTKCTSCQDNMSLNAEGECKLICAEDEFLEVAINGKCLPCTDNCKTCQVATNNCLSCVENTFFYGNSCIDSCPTIDGYKYVPNEEG